jgi:uncharacterized protein YndB with AHSA1/START domain
VADIRHRVGIAAPADRVYQAVATPEGVAGWWSDHVEGDRQVGGSLRVFFGSPEPTMEARIVELSPNQRVRWHVENCLAADWVGTNITFELKPAEGGTVVLFNHNDWQEPVEFMHHCSTRWATFLLGLKSSLEGGKSTRYPDEPPISFDWR